MPHDVLLAEATRGNRVESRHYGAAVVVDATGKTVFAAGDVETPIYPVPPSRHCRPCHC